MHSIAKFLSAAIVTIGWTAMSPAIGNDEVSAQSRPNGGISSYGDTICPPGTARAGKRVRKVAFCNSPGAGAQRLQGVPAKK